MKLTRYTQFSLGDKGGWLVNGLGGASRPCPAHCGLVSSSSLQSPVSPLDTDELSARKALTRVLRFLVFFNPGIGLGFSKGNLMFAFEFGRCVIGEWLIDRLAEWTSGLPGRLDGLLVISRAYSP
jgi:hypothetical protein